jgi:hypothetical protein
VKVLLDHCVPRPFARQLPGHDIRTAYEMGWAALRNGELLTHAAAAGFGAFITVDHNLAFQQNRGELPLAVIAIHSKDNRPDTLAMFAPSVLRLLASELQRRVYVAEQ